MNRLKPRPPQISLPNAMEMNPPRNAIHRGRQGGRTRPSSRPVTNALPSVSLPKPGRAEANSHSVPTAPRVAALTIKRAVTPKNQAAASTTGTNA